MMRRWRHWIDGRPPVVCVGLAAMTAPVLRYLALLAVLIVAPAQSARATLVTLYDDALGNTPSQQDWLTYAADSLLSGGVAQQTLAPAGGVRLVTDGPVSAGYSNYNPLTLMVRNPAFPSLDRSAGFRLSFELQLDFEQHSSNDRAGFSVLLLADDLFGIELGFWTNEVWAQEVGFVHAEGQAFDLSSEALYQLSVLGNGYSFSDGITTLSGSLRDYSAFGVPYNLANFLYLGDDTGSAQADVTLGQISLQTDTAAVPLPPTATLVLAALLLVRRSARRQRAGRR